MRLSDWFKLEPDGDQPRKMPRNERQLCCVFCDAFAIIVVDDIGPLVVCVRDPTHRERP